MRLRTLFGTVAATVSTAILGSLATDPSSSWYRGLDKPSWQPPPLAYPLVWTPLYLDLAVTSAAALDTLNRDTPALETLALDAGASEGRTSERARLDQTRLKTALAVNLGLNAGWNWLFFRAHRPRLAAIECAALTVSSADLVRRIAAVDRRAGAALAPYALWCGFATALTAAIARRNP